MAEKSKFYEHSTEKSPVPYRQRFEFKKFNQTIIQLRLLGTSFVIDNSYPIRAHGKIVK